MYRSLYRTMLSVHATLCSESVHWVGPADAGYGRYKGSVRTSEQVLVRNGGTVGKIAVCAGSFLARWELVY